MKNEMASPVKSLLVIVLLFISVGQSFAQKVIWKEGFITVDNNQDTPYSTSNGQWLLTSLGTNASMSNTWYMDIRVTNSGAGNCVMVVTNLDSTKTLDSTYIGGNSTGSSGNGTGVSTGGVADSTGKDTAIVVSTDDSPVLFLGLNNQSTNTTYFAGAFFSNDVSAATHWRIESPVINLSGKKDVILSFEYLLGALDDQTQFTVSYYDGSSWIDLPALSNTFSETCPSPRTSKWAASPVLSLPASVNNLANFKIAFSFVSTAGLSKTNNAAGKAHATKGSVKSARMSNTSSTTGVNTPQVSVAIDNITISGTNVDNGTESTLRAVSSEAPVSVSDPKRKIEFTVYPNPNRGVFTVDFSGIENNHEVEILLCNIQNGQIVYKTTFFSQTTEHNKVDVVPSNTVEPGRYVCALVCEGIRLNATVVIH